MAAPASVASSTLGSFRILDTVGAQQGEGHFEYRYDMDDMDAIHVCYIRTGSTAIVVRI